MCFLSIFLKTSVLDKRYRNIVKNDHFVIQLILNMLIKKHASLTNNLVANINSYSINFNNENNFFKNVWYNFLFGNILFQMCGKQTSYFCFLNINVWYHLFKNIQFFKWQIKSTVNFPGLILFSKIPITFN